MDRKEYNRLYRLNNKEKIAEYNRKYKAKRVRPKKVKPKKENKYYFDEDRFSKLILKYNKNETNLSEENYIAQQVDSIIRAIIFTHKMIRFDDYDYLVSIAREAIYRSIPKFNPSATTQSGKPPTWFNYLSLVAKKSLIYQTIKDRKHRITCDYDEISNYEQSYEPRDSFDIHSSIKQEIEIYINTTNKKDYIKSELKLLSDEMIRFLQTGSNPTKSEFSSYITARYPNILPCRKREFYRIIFEIKSKIFNLL